MAKIKCVQHRELWRHKYFTSFYIDIIVYHHLLQLNIAVVNLLPFWSLLEYTFEPFLKISSSVWLAKRFAIFNMDAESLIIRVISPGEMASYTH
jgi:hypothetical protein